MTEALIKASSLVSREESARILILSDGQWTGTHPEMASSELAIKNISVDYRIMERPATNDLAIYDVNVASQVTPNQSFLITAWIKTPLKQNVNYCLTRNKTVITQSKLLLNKGLNRILFRGIAGFPGTLEYNLKVTGSGNDPVNENNLYRFLVTIKGIKPVLLVNDSGISGFSKLLRKNKIDVIEKKPAQCLWGLSDLTNYSAVILQNIPARAIGKEGMHNIAEWIRQTSAGFMMTGGKSAFGPGGFFKSPLEKIMPVTMELKSEHRKLSLAIAIVMDRSGSMGMTVPDGRTKMDLANIACVQVLDMLTQMDELGVIAVDSAPHVIVPLNPVDKVKAFRSDILGIRSEGGGIFVYSGLVQGAEMLLKAKSKTRHIILFADSADAEEPGKYKELLDKCSKTNITVSVVALGTPGDKDAAFLEDVARRGKGRIFYTTSADELPRLFAQDTLVVSRSCFIDEPTQVKASAGILSLTSIPYNLNTKIGGYNLCYIRPMANQSAYTIDEYKSPFVSSWTPGVGRVLCYTGQVDGKFTGQIANWKEYGSFLSSLVKWTSGSSESLGSDLMLTQNLANGLTRIKLHLDPYRKSLSLPEPPDVVTLFGKIGQKPEVIKSKMKYIDPNTLEANINMKDSSTYISTIHLHNGKKITLPPQCLPYSPEFKPYRINRGRDVLQKLANVTNGKERINLVQIWDDLPIKSQYIDISGWLLMIAILLFLIEIFERRTRIMSSIGKNLLLKYFYKKTSVIENNNNVVESTQTVLSVKPEKSVNQVLSAIKKADRKKK